MDDNRVDTIEISEVGSVLTKIESFCIKPQVGYCWMSIGSFSPTTYRISVSVHCDRVLILDVRNSEQLLEGEGHYGSHSFSPDGNLFAIWSLSRVNIWKYTSSRYTPWRELPIKCSISDTSPLQFSPTSSSVLVSPSRIPQVWRLDGPPTVARPNSRTPLVVLSHCGTYIATWYQAGSTITITGPHSQTTPHYIDIGMEIFVPGFTGNILLVLEKTRIPMGLANLVAWRLTERGVVDGILQTEGQVAVTAFGP